MKLYHFTSPLHVKGCIKRRPKMEAEKIIDDLCLIDNVVVNYSEGGRRGFTDEETEDRALKAVSMAIEILARAGGSRAGGCKMIKFVVHGRPVRATK